MRGLGSGMCEGQSAGHGGCRHALSWQDGHAQCRCSRCAGACWRRSGGGGWHCHISGCGRAGCSGSGGGRLGGMAQGVGGDGRRLRGVGIVSCRHMQRHGVGHRHWLEGGQGAPYGPRLRAMHRLHWLRHRHRHGQRLWHRQWHRLGSTQTGCIRHRHGHRRGGRQSVGG